MKSSVGNHSLLVSATAFILGFALFVRVCVQCVACLLVCVCLCSALYCHWLLFPSLPLQSSFSNCISFANSSSFSLSLYILCSGMRYWIKDCQVLFALFLLLSFFTIYAVFMWCFAFLLIWNNFFKSSTCFLLFFLFSVKLICSVVKIVKTHFTRSTRHSPILSSVICVQFFSTRFLHSCIFS